MKKEYFKFELRSIDAWRYDGLWEWNASYKLEDGFYIAEHALNTRSLLQILRQADYLSNASKGKLTIWTDGDVYEIQNRKTGEPLLALIPSS